MSLPIDVSDLIHQKKVERTRIEYKSGWNPEPIIHTITAFANDIDNIHPTSSWMLFYLKYLIIT